MSPNTYVAAIDFGTTYSGYAYSSQNSFTRDPLSIITNRVWQSDTVASYKTPTTILFDKRMAFVAFGYKAEQLYLEKCEEGLGNSYPLFRRFKLHLHNNSILNRDTQLKSVQGIEGRALTVFSESIRYLKEHMLKNLENEIPNIKSKDIQWVLTVPAIWNDAAKQFMREAAEMAGIDRNRLLIALEPEAASIYCRKLGETGMASLHRGPRMTHLQPNTSYMIIDIGGGTTDISVHEITADKSVMEVTKSSGGAWGGLKVDEEFHRIMSAVYGQRIMEEFDKDFLEDSFRLTMSMEYLKCVADMTYESLTLDVPQTLRDLFTKNTCESQPVGHQYGDWIKFISGKIRFSRSSLLREIFKPTLDPIVGHLKDLRQRITAVRKVNYAYVVGSLTLSPLVLEALRAAFAEVTFVTAEDPVMAVVKGAVLFGHDPTKAIFGRRSAFTYGIAVTQPFDACRHPIEKKFVYDGIDGCDDVFDKIIAEDQLLKSDEIISKLYNPTKSDATEEACTLYKASNENNDPKFVTDEGVEKIGTLAVDMPDTSGGGKRKIRVNIRVGGTELEVDARDVNSGKTFTAKFEFL